MSQNTEPNRCLKCQKEIEPQYFYCEKCADKRMKWQLVLAIFLSAIILFSFTAIYNLLKPSVDELIYMSLSPVGTDKIILCGVISGIFTLVHYTITFGLIRFIWKKFKYADSKSREVSEEKKPKTIKVRNEPQFIVGIDISEGTHSFVAINSEGGLVHILSNENMIIDRILIKKKKKIKLKLGTTVKLFNCVIDSIPIVEGGANDTNKIRFCRKCGEKLINNSRFCRKCATEIVSAEDD